MHRRTRMTISAKLTAVGRKDQTIQENLARSIIITEEDLSDLIARVRARLKASRRKVPIQMFQLYEDDSGELALPEILNLVTDLGVMPSSDQERIDFLLWIRRLAFVEVLKAPSSEESAP